MLTIKNLRKRYGNFQALDGLNLEVADGELFGFVGPNGAGKTTTLKILAGLLVPDEGEVEIGGLDVYSDGKELRRRIGYVPDFFGVYDNLKVSEYMEFFASCYGITGLQARTRCHTLLEQVRLEDKEDFFVDGLSRGMKQRLCLARALIHDPDLLILDEPTAGLDPKERIRIRNLISDLSEDRIVLIATHVVSDIEFISKEILLMKNGRLVDQDSPENLQKRIYGHVYELCISQDELAEVKKEYEISNLFRRDGEIIVRVIADKCPVKYDAVKVSPTLEDVYLYEFEGVKRR